MLICLAEWTLSTVLIGLPSVIFALSPAHSRRVLLWLAERRTGGESTVSSTHTRTHTKLRAHVNEL